MKAKASPAMVLLAVIILCAIVGGIYWRTMGPGNTTPQAEKWNKPPSMGELKMPNVPPPPPKQ